MRSLVRMIYVESVRYLRDYEVRVTFTNGVTKDVNLEGELWGEVFEPLKELDLFQKVRVGPESQTLEWPNGADLAPEFLYESGKTIRPAE